MSNGNEFTHFVQIIQCIIYDIIEYIPNRECICLCFKSNAMCQNCSNINFLPFSSNAAVVSPNYVSHSNLLQNRLMVIDPHNINRNRTNLLNFAFRSIRKTTINNIHRYILETNCLSEQVSKNQNKNQPKQPTFFFLSSFSPVLSFVVCKSTKQFEQEYIDTIILNTI